MHHWKKVGGWLGFIAGALITVLSMGYNAWNLGKATIALGLPLSAWSAIGALIVVVSVAYMLVQSQRDHEAMRRLVGAGNVAVAVPVGEPAMKAAVDGLVIHAALYGTNGKYFDLRDKLQKRVTDNTLDVIAQFPDDPIPYQPKVLIVLYSYGQAEPKYIALREGDHLTISKQATGTTTLTLQDLLIGNNEFNRLTDITNQLQEKWTTDARRALMAETAMEDLKAKGGQYEEKLIRLQFNFDNEKARGDRYGEELQRIKEVIEERAAEAEKIKKDLTLAQNKLQFGDIQLAETKSYNSRLRLWQLTQRMWYRDRSAPRQPFVRIRYIDWNQSHSLADKIEAVFKNPLDQFSNPDWYVFNKPIDGEGVKRVWQSRVVMESRINNLASSMVEIFNDGNLIGEKAVPDEAVEEHFDNEDLILTVFPPTPNA